VRVGEECVEVGHAKAVLVVLVDEPVRAGPAIEVAAHRVAVARVGVVCAEPMGRVVVVGKRMELDPEVVRLPLQRAELARLGERLVHHGRAGAATPDDEDRPFDPGLGDLPVRAAELARNAAAVVADGLVDFDQELAHDRFPRQQLSSATVISLSNSLR
jgi:hypothetical protein